jgi:hypothetical protein
MKYIVISILVTLVACNKKEPTEPQPSSDRFQLVQLGSMRRDQFLLDKQTGTIWQNTCLYGNNGPDCDFGAWMKQDVEELTHSKQVLYDTAKTLRELGQNKKSK